MRRPAQEEQARPHDARCGRLPCVGGRRKISVGRRLAPLGRFMCKRHGPAIGHVVRDLMNKIQNAGAAGNTDAFHRFTRSVAREVPKPEIVA